MPLLKPVLKCKRCQSSDFFHPVCLSKCLINDTNAQCHPNGFQLQQRAGNASLESQHQEQLMHKVKPSTPFHPFLLMWELCLATIEISAIELEGVSVKTQIKLHLLDHIATIYVRLNPRMSCTKYYSKFMILRHNFRCTHLYSMPHEDAPLDPQALPFLGFFRGFMSRISICSQP